MTVSITLNSPVKLNNTLNKIKDRMSSTNAAVMIACPKSSCKTLASPKRRRAMPTLVGARAVPTEIASGRKGFPKAMVKRAPVINGKIVPSTATTQAQGPTFPAFSKSKCMPLSKIISATPVCPMRVKKSGDNWQSVEIFDSQLLTRHSSTLPYEPPPPKRRCPPWPLWSPCSLASLWPPASESSPPCSPWPPCPSLTFPWCPEPPCSPLTFPWFPELPFSPLTLPWCSELPFSPLTLPWCPRSPCSS
mmetsp:Transcript_78132/g.238959  ORF Transcript_78132/g.238959 Transcript_78132/m.238959 type:complete len:248 (-) Transcript_78132:423-1166(-)